uniref:Transposase-associated domain-containing protein n=1 Tax=Oryza nivara TaxID=4536 RepID=A0A0E0I1E9_ORYNI
MDKDWMKTSRSSAEYNIGVDKFIEFALSNSAHNNRIICPCKNCGNRYWLGEHKVREHLICDGFLAGYTSWIHHGESMSTSKPSVASSSHHEQNDDMDQMLLEGLGIRTLGTDDGAEDDLDVDAEAYYKLVNDGSQELYPGCKNAISVDGQALNDCVDILVNTVFNQHTIIPRAYGMISKLGSAQARCIPWPRDNLMHPSGQALHSKVSTIARHNSANQGNSVALTEVFKHNSIDNALQSVVGHKREVHDLTPKENIRREDTHSRAKKIGKARPDSPYANFTNSQLLTTSRSKCMDRFWCNPFSGCVFPHCKYMRASQDDRGKPLSRSMMFIVL